jgi:23S rRNA (pseudouridine1915-N3)-methyltransferase
MKIRILTITHKVPGWIKLGYEDYAKRLPATCALELIEIPAEKRGSQIDTKRLLTRESEKMLKAIHPNHRVIALSIDGALWSTETLAKHLANWLESGRNIDLLIGGPEGLSDACLERAEQAWSLSPLTFPHFLVRLLIAEQAYRAYSILNQHPYHR